MGAPFSARQGRALRLPGGRHLPGVGDKVGRGVSEAKDLLKDELLHISPDDILPSSPADDVDSETPTFVANYPYGPVDAGINIEDLPQIPLGPHVNLSAFGPNGVRKAEYTIVKTLTRLPQLFLSAIGVGDLMCVVFPSTCKAPPLIGTMLRRRRRRSPRRMGGRMGGRRSGFGGFGKYKSPRRRKLCQTTHSTSKKKKDSPKKDSPKPASLKDDSSSQGSDSSQQDSGVPPRRVHIKNFNSAAEMLTMLVETGVSTARGAFDIANEQSDRQSAAADDYDYDSSSDYDSPASSQTTVPVTRKSTNVSATTTTVKSSSVAPSTTRVPARKGINWSG